MFDLRLENDQLKEKLQMQEVVIAENKRVIQSLGIFSLEGSFIIFLAEKGDNQAQYQNSMTEWIQNLKCQVLKLQVIIEKKVCDWLFSRKKNWTSKNSWTPMYSKISS